MNRKNLPIIAGIGIPALMILFVTGSIYVPGLFVKPKYNFLYAIGLSYNEYTVSNGKLVKVPPPAAPSSTNLYPPYPAYPSYPQPAPKFYVYDVAQDKSNEISFGDAQNLSLNTDNQSPDGFEVVSGNYGGDFLFFGGSNYDGNSRYLTGHNVSRKLNLAAGGMTSPYGYNDFTFLGWINQ